MTPEAKVKKKVVAQLKELHAYYFYPVTGGYGRSGVPDIIGCYRVLFFGIECKAGKNKPTPLQEKNLKEISFRIGVCVCTMRVILRSIDLPAQPFQFVLLERS